MAWNVFCVLASVGAGLFVIGLCLLLLVLLCAFVLGLVSGAR